MSEVRSTPFLGLVGWLVLSHNSRAIIMVAQYAALLNLRGHEPKISVDLRVRGVIYIYVLHAG